VRNMGRLVLMAILAILTPLAAGNNFTSIEDYDFDMSDLNETVVISTNGSAEELSWDEAITQLYLTDIEMLKTLVKKQEADINELHEDNRKNLNQWEVKTSSMQKEWNDEKKELEAKSTLEKKLLLQQMATEKGEWEKEKNMIQKKQEKATKILNNRITNKNVLIRFLTFRVKNGGKRAKISGNTIKAQNEKLKALGKERKSYQEKNKMNLRQAYLQAGVIMKQEIQKTALKEALIKEVDLRHDFYNLTELSKPTEVDVEDFPAYVQMMTKTIVDQTQDLRKLRLYLEEEAGIEDSMRKLLEEMEKLNITFSSDIEEWNLLEEMMDLVKVQSDSLASLKPTISYIVNHNRFDFWKVIFSSSILVGSSTRRTCRGT